MTKEWIRNFQGGLIAGYFGILCFAFVAKILCDNWNSTIFTISGASLVILILLISSELFLKFLNKQK